MTAIDVFAYASVPWGPATTTTASATTNSVSFAPRSADYKCGTCRKRYRRFEPTVSCCVLHSPGTCCHAFEQRITKKGYPKERVR